MSKFAAIEETSQKLPNGKLVDRVYLEKEISKVCHYVQNVVIAQKDDRNLIAMIFPNKKLFTNPDYEKTPEEGCFCPRNLKELGKCLSGCMHTLNLTLQPGYAKVDAAVIINTELSVADGTLTPAMNVVEENVVKKYKDHLNNLYSEKVPVKEEAFNMKLIMP